MQGQIFLHNFDAKWWLLCLLSFKYFHPRPLFLGDIRQAVKRQSNSVGVKNISITFKTFNSIQFNNLFGTKTECANVKHKCCKLGDTLGGYPLHHVTCLDQSRAKDIYHLPGYNPRPRLLLYLGLVKLSSNAMLICLIYCDFSLYYKSPGKRGWELLRVQTLALVWPETLMRSQRLSCALIKFESVHIVLESRWEFSLDRLARSDDSRRELKKTLMSSLTEHCTISKLRNTIRGTTQCELRILRNVVLLKFVFVLNIWGELIHLLLC